MELTKDMFSQRANTEAVGSVVSILRVHVVAVKVQIVCPVHRIRSGTPIVPVVASVRGRTPKKCLSF